MVILVVVDNANAYANFTNMTTKQAQSDAVTLAQAQSVEELIEGIFRTSGLLANPVVSLRALQNVGHKIVATADFSASGIEAMPHIGGPSILINDSLVKLPETSTNPEELAFEAAKLDSIGAEEELRAAEGGAIPAVELGRRINLSDETVTTYRKKGILIGLPKGRRNWEYPAWQACQGQLLPGLDKVLAALAEKRLSPLSAVSFFLTKSEDIDDLSPLELLRAGRIEEAVEHAQRHGDIGS